METRFGEIVFFAGPHGEPLIKINASESFKGMSPVDQALYLASAMQVARMCLEALIVDNSGEADEIRRLMGQHTIEMLPGPTLN